MNAKIRRQCFFDWLEENKYRIKYARKGYSDHLLNDYNDEHRDNAIKNKEELWRWLYHFRRHNGIGIHYCPTKRKYVRSRPEHSNYIREN